MPKIALALIVALVLYRLVFVLFVPLDISIHYTNDDACYYMEIARNLADGDGFSFDELHQTNGFHPLWLGIIAIPYLLGAGLLGGYYIGMSLTILLFGFGLYQAWQFVRKRFGETAGLIIILACAWPQIINNLISGMEVTLTFALVMTALRLAERHELAKFKAPPRVEWGVGVLLALIFLSRLDTAFLHIALAAFFLRTYLGKKRAPERTFADFFKRGLRLFGPTALVLGGYLLWNYLTFGHLTPISGALKSSFPIPGFYLSSIAYRELGVVVFLSLVWVFVRRRSLSPATHILAWGVGGQLLYYLFFLHWAPFSYYLIALALPLFLLALGDMIRVLTEKKPSLKLWLSISATVVAITGQAISLTRLDLGFASGSYQAALWTRNNTPADSIVTMRDCAIFGYFSDRRTINLDGLVNDYEYQEYVSQGKLSEYLEENGVDYFVHHAVTDAEYEEMPFYIPGRLHGGGSTITLRVEDEIYRGTPYTYYAPGSIEMMVAVWEHKGSHWD
jgi:hypothetical protein